jgi:hypothetical protein
MGHDFFKNLHEKFKRCPNTHDDTVDLREEIADLTEVYSEKAQCLFEQEERYLGHLIGTMKRFIEIHEERKCMEDKLDCLNRKIENAKCQYSHSGE